MNIVLQSLIQVLLHLFRDKGAHREEIVGRESSGSVTYRINGHPQQYVFHLITILSVDVVYLVLQHSVLE